MMTQTNKSTVQNIGGGVLERKPGSKRDRGKGEETEQFKGSEKAGKRSCPATMARRRERIHR